MITLSKVSYAYPGREPALKDIDFHLEEGRTLGLVGPNGSGKSTILALLTGLFAPTEGRIQVGLHASPGGEKEIRALTGLVLQDADLHVLGATVGEDLCLGIDNGDRRALEQARILADRFDLTDLWESPGQTLSWGQKRKLCIAGVLRKKPSVMLLDEPFSGLDYPGAREVRAILAENKRLGLTQVAAAHDLEPLADLADQWAVLNRGRLVLFGPASEVFDRVDEFGVRPPCSWQAGLGTRPWDWGMGKP